METTKEELRYAKIGKFYYLNAPAFFNVPIRPVEDVVCEFYSLTKGGRLTCKVGTKWDGASGARDTESNMRASLVHDVLIYMVQDKLIRNDWYTKWLVDSQYMRLAREDGMLFIRRWLHFFGIQWNQWQNKFKRTVSNG